MLQQIIAEMFKSDRPMATRLAHGLTLVIVPGKCFKAGRKGAPVGDDEITTVEDRARKAGHALGVRRTYDTANGWNIVEWSLAVAESPAQTPLIETPAPPVNPYQFD